MRPKAYQVLWIGGGGTHAHLRCFFQTIANTNVYVVYGSGCSLSLTCQVAIVNKT